MRPSQPTIGATRSIGIAAACRCMPRSIARSMIRRGRRSGAVSGVLTSEAGRIQRRGAAQQRQPPAESCTNRRGRCAFVVDSVDSSRHVSIRIRERVRRPAQTDSQTAEHRSGRSREAARRSRLGPRALPSPGRRPFGASWTRPLDPQDACELVRAVPPRGSKGPAHGSLSAIRTAHLLSTMRFSSLTACLAAVLVCDAAIWDRGRGDRREIAVREAIPQVGAAMAFLRDDKVLGHIPCSDVSANICAEIEGDTTRSKKRLMAACAWPVNVLGLTAQTWRPASCTRAGMTCRASVSNGARTTCPAARSAWAPSSGSADRD